MDNKLGLGSWQNLVMAGLGRMIDSARASAKCNDDWNLMDDRFCCDNTDIFSVGTMQVGLGLQMGQGKSSESNLPGLWSMQSADTAEGTIREQGTMRED